MSELVRFSVSLEAELLERFDHYCADRKIATRSEAIRQLFNEKLTSCSWAEDAANAAGTLTLVFEHQHAKLVEKMLALQHQHADCIVSNTHIHLDHDTCLEVIVLRGRAGAIQTIAAELQGLKGIKQGQLVLARADHTHPHRHTNGTQAHEH